MTQGLFLITGIIHWYATVLNAYFPFHHKILKTTLLQGQDLIKLMISASSSMTFLNETGIFFSLLGRGEEYSDHCPGLMPLPWFMQRLWFYPILFLHHPCKFNTVKKADVFVLSSKLFWPHEPSDRVPETPGKGLGVSQKSVEPAWEPFTVLYNQQSFPYLRKSTVTPRLHPTCGPYSN